MSEFIEVKISPRSEWRGELLFTITAAPEKPIFGWAGKEAGDIRVVETPGAKDGALKGTVSLGAADKVDAEKMRRAGAAIAKWLAKNETSGAGVDLAGLDGYGLEDPIQALAEGILLAAFRFSRFKSDVSERPVPQVCLLAGREISAALTSLERASLLTDSVNLARSLAHEPPNVINPVTLAERAQAFASENGLKCTILDDRQLAEMGAGAILAVGKGSQTPSRLIILEYSGTKKGAKPVVVVGKAITFDTGGYTLKINNGMLGMKYDKCGGMNVIGILKAASALKLKTPVVGVIAAAENMISSESYRPNDILTTLSGKTVEVISADAEGRLVLCDALTYAQKHYQPRAIIDLATLTGGVVVALGSIRAGIFSNNDHLANALLASGERTFERMWRLPMDDEYLELIKGDDSDIKNSGGARGAHPIQGAIFLKQFVSDEVPWAHLDIAGTADTDKDLPYASKGATGFGVRLVIDYLKHLEK